MIKVDILGSCVSRDAFNYLNENDFKLGKYFARSSVISLYSNPVPVKMEDIKLPSTFQQRMVYWDLTKEFSKYIKNVTSDFIILDFIDERIRILKTRDTYITRSREFASSGLTISGVIFPDEERLELWKEKAQHLVNDLKSTYLPERIILHKSFWKTKYKGKDGKIHEFKDPEIDHNNKLLNEYYKFIQNQIPEVNVIQLDQYISDENHIWGLSPFHYEEEYYMNFIEQVNKIVTSNRDGYVTSRKEVEETIEKLLSNKMEVTKADKELIKLLVNQIFDGVQKELNQMVPENWGSNIG